MGYLGSLDKSHQSAMKRKEEREVKKQMLQKKVLESSSSVDQELEVCENFPEENEVSDDELDSDSDFEEPKSKQQNKPLNITLQVPRHITKAVALNAKRFKISDNACASTLAVLIQESNGNLDDFVLSKSTARRVGASEVTADSLRIREEFASKITGRNLTLHFDGKAVPEFTGGRLL